MDSKDILIRDLIPTPYYKHKDDDTNDDLNVAPYTTQGVHYLYNWTNLENAPTNLNSYELIVTTKVFENYVTQKLLAVFSLKKYVRIRKGVGVPWTAWTSSEDLSQETLETIMDTKDNGLRTALENTMDTEDNASRIIIENKIYQPYQDDRGLPTNTVIDLDTKTASGVYLMYKLANLQNAPSEDIGSYEMILDVKLFDSYVIQELIAVFSERRYSRLRKGTTWSSWKRIDIDGIDLNPRTIINHPTSFDFNSN